jgi:predicted dehydrogenase
MSGVLLAGGGTPGSGQDHHGDMYRPAVDALGLAVVDRLEDADLVVVCPDVTAPEALADLLARAAEARTPVVVDKPTLFGTDVLDDLARQFPGVLASHHPRFHPAITTASGRVRSGALGLLHAVHGELLVAGGDQPHVRGELRNLAVYCLDVVQSLVGELRGRAHVIAAPSGPDGAGEAYTISLRLEPDVAVTLMVGRAGRSAMATDRATLHRYRILGSHGQLLVDLDSPAFDVVGGGRIPFGPDSVTCMLQAALAGTTAPDLGHAAALAHVLDALAAAATSRQATTLPTTNERSTR